MGKNNTNLNHEIYVVNNQCITKDSATFHIRETGVFKIKKFITDDNGNELFKYSVSRQGCVLYDNNKVPILNVTIKDDKDMYIYLGQGSDKVLAVLQKNKNSSYGEQSYTASYNNLALNQNEVIDIIFNKYKKIYTLILNRNKGNESTICSIERSGKKYSLKVSPSVDYVFMIGINLCLLKLTEIEELETFESSHNELQPSHYNQF